MPLHFICVLHPNVGSGRHARAATPWFLALFKLWKPWLPWAQSGRWPGDFSQTLQISLQDMAVKIRCSKNCYAMLYEYGSIPIDTFFRGMNIHLPAILMFTRGTRFWHTAIYGHARMVKDHQTCTICKLWVEITRDFAGTLIFTIPYSAVSLSHLLLTVCQLRSGWKWCTG